MNNFAGEEGNGSRMEKMKSKFYKKTGSLLLLNKLSKFFLKLSRV